MCAASQLSVPAIGFTCFDHCQPGSKVARPTGPPSRLTNSSLPLPSSNGRVSSGDLRLLRIKPAMAGSSLRVGDINVVLVTQCGRDPRMAPSDGVVHERREPVRVNLPAG